MSGQVFRWQRGSDDRWRGIDGESTYVFDANTGECQTNVSEDRARRYLGADADLDDRVARLDEADPGIGSLARQWLGLGLMQPESLTETIVSFICSSNNHLPRITGMVNRLAERFGRASGSEPSVNALPGLEEIALLKYEQLAEMGFGYRSKFVIDSAKALTLNPSWEAGLRAMTYATARSRLMDLPGVGRKVADCICLYGLGHREAVPVDIHLWNAFRRRFQPGWDVGALTDSRYAEIGNYLRERFGQDAGYVQLLMYYDRQVAPKRTRN